MLGAQALEKDFASPVCLPRVKVGDLVHVFEGQELGWLEVEMLVGLVR